MKRAIAISSFVVFAGMAACSGGTDQHGADDVDVIGDNLGSVKSGEAQNNLSGTSRTQLRFSIDVPTGAGTEDPVIELGQDDVGFRQLENRQLLADLLARLPERDRRIVELRFIEELTQSEIAARVGVSQMCVSRVLARTLGRLRLWARTAVG